MTATALIILELILRYGPAATRELIAIFQKPAPTDADWQRVFALTEKPYETYTAPKP